jgi:methoxymalonate biosynthesis acyl carrier protein
MEAAIQTDIKSAIREFLQKRIGQEVGFTDEDDIFQLGLVNSLFALELVVFLENTFQIAVENDDLKLEHFSTINNLGNFISRKKGLDDTGI